MGRSRIVISPRSLSDNTNTCQLLVNMVEVILGVPNASNRKGLLPRLRCGESYLTVVVRLRRQPLEGLAHGGLFARFDVLPPAHVKHRESLIRPREHGDLGTIPIELGARQRP